MTAIEQQSATKIETQQYATKIEEGHSSTKIELVFWAN